MSLFIAVLWYLQVFQNILPRELHHKAFELRQLNCCSGGVRESVIAESVRNKRILDANGTVNI